MHVFAVFTLIYGTNDFSAFSQCGYKSAAVVCTAAASWFIRSIVAKLLTLCRG